MSFDRAKKQIRFRIAMASNRVDLAESDKEEATCELDDLTTWAAATPEDRATVLAMADRLAVGREKGECSHSAQSRIVEFAWAEDAGLLGDYDPDWGERSVTALGELAAIIAFRGSEWALKAEDVDHE